MNALKSWPSCNLIFKGIEPELPKLPEGYVWERLGDTQYSIPLNEQLNTKSNNVEYYLGDIILYKGFLYVCLKTHDTDKTKYNYTPPADCFWHPVFLRYVDSKTLNFI